MSFFDNLKHQAAQGANQTTQKGGAATGNVSYTVSFPELPVNLAQLQAMPEGALQKPEHTAALTVAVLCIYPVNRDAALEMLNYLQGPRGITPYDKQFLADRFRDKDYVPRSYFAGATPQNNYEPSEPLTVRLFENLNSSHSFGRKSNFMLTLYLSSSSSTWSIRPP